MAVTIYDVARHAGVGIGTVSRTINGSSQISRGTKEKVLRAIQELKYEPHALARGLARRKTNTIAVILPSFTGYFYFELLKGIQSALSNSAYDMILYNVESPDKTDLFLKRTLKERRVDGVILISLDISEKDVQRFLKAQFPIVLVDRSHDRLESIIVQNKAGAYLATEYLISLGHQCIGMIDGQLHSAPAKVRLDGYKDALSKNKMTFNDQYLVISEDYNDKDGFNREAGYQAMQKLLNLEGDCPTAVFISSDIQAAGAIRAVREKGKEIPSDIAIVGFDDIEIAEYLGLTTIHQPLFEMGKMACSQLLDKIEDFSLPAKQHTLSTHLVIRETCGGKKKFAFSA